MMNWQKMKGLLLFSFIFVSCTQTVVDQAPKKPRFSGDHTTIQIRGLWYVCIQARQRGLPQLPPPVHSAHCDCVLDKSREQFSAKDYEKMQQGNLTKVFTDINLECQMLNNLNPSQINPTSV
jgi:hypothetical protein